ncbi:ThuA domain-containing protein [Streptomyces sp. NPDC049813]|uniref:ThuA domain-containing protein n=1 Tax=Streptomyces sp. NPDC049813 TaxID=3365597 RepID=UPI00378BF1C6
MTKRAIIVRGGWDGHQPEAATDLFLPHLTRNGFTYEVFDSPAVYADADRMAATDLVVQCMTMSTIERAEVRGLRAAIEAGTGLAGWHGGIVDAYRADAEYLHLVGAQFAHHPGKEPDLRTGEQCDNYLPHRIDILPSAAEHPVTAGIESFDLVTEQYWVLTDGLLDVLATTTLPARPWAPWHRPHTCPAVWTRRWGEGRVFACTPGHRVETLQDPNVRTIIERGMLWAAR